MYSNFIKNPAKLKSYCSLVAKILIHNLSGILIHCQICLFAIKDIYNRPIEIIKGLTDKGQCQYLTKLMGPQEGTYLYTTQFHSLR